MNFAVLKAHKEQSYVDETNKAEEKLRDKAMRLIRKVEEDIAKLLRTGTNETNGNVGPHDGITMNKRRKKEKENVRQMKSPPEEDLERIIREIENQKPPLWHR